VGVGVGRLVGDPVVGFMVGALVGVRVGKVGAEEGTLTVGDSVGNCVGVEVFPQKKANFGDEGPKERHAAVGKTFTIVPEHAGPSIRYTRSIAQWILTERYTNPVDTT
jgi:hypothetical protein